MLTEATRENIKALLTRYPDARSALLPALHLAQREAGWLTDDALCGVADALDLSSAHVRGVATFHELFRNTPTGRHVIQLCTNVSCMLFDADSLVDLLRKHFSLEPGGTSPDGRFSLIVMECIGACDGAPAMLVDADLHEHLTASRILSILEGYA